MIASMIGPGQAMILLVLLLVAGIIIAIVAVTGQRNKNSEGRNWENESDKHPENNH